MADERGGQEITQEEQDRLDAETYARRREALAQVRQWGDPVLKMAARPVERFDRALRSEIAEMSRLMDAALGAGLAATQLGVLRRVLVYRLPDGPLRALVNPEITWRSEETEVFGEGCLSLQGVWLDVERPAVVRVRAYDGKGGELEFEARGPEASVVQHEIDHLDGVLILDRVPKDERRAAVRRLHEYAAR